MPKINKQQVGAAVDRYRASLAQRKPTGNFPVVRKTRSNMRPKPQIGMTGDGTAYRVPPGLAKRNKVPRGLAKKGGIPPGLAKKKMVPGALNNRRRRMNRRALIQAAAAKRMNRG